MGAPLLRTTNGRTPKGRLPQAGDRETEHGSVSARRMAGISKCVVTAGTAHFGMEAMRELQRKGKRSHNRAVMRRFPVRSIPCAPARPALPAERRRPALTRSSGNSEVKALCESESISGNATNHGLTPLPVFPATSVLEPSLLERVGFYSSEKSNSAPAFSGEILIKRAGPPPCPSGNG